MTKTFHYHGRDQQGKLVTGKIEVPTLEEVIIHLTKNNITPLDITPIQASILKTRNFLSLFQRLHKVKDYHLMNFFRQLGLLSDAGLSIIKAINKLSESASSPTLGTILAQVATDITAGLNLAEALKKHPTIFSPLMINIVDIGENTGHLSESLRHLSAYLETTVMNRRRLLSAIRYPLFVIITIISAILIVNFMVIPKFAMMFSHYHLDLPLATRIIMATSSFMITNKNLLIILTLLSLIGTNRLLTIPKIRYLWDKYKLRVPIFGNLLKRIHISQFAWTFSLILRSNVPIIKGLKLASTAVPNTYFNSQLLKMSTAIEHGENLSRAAIASNLFTPITIQMIEVGEESEKLDEALSEITKYYDAEIDYDLKRLNELIEPILLALLGVVILILAVGVYFPLWDLIKIAKL